MLSPLVIKIWPVACIFFSLSKIRAVSQYSMAPSCSHCTSPRSTLALLRDWSKERLAACTTLITLVEAAGVAVAVLAGFTWALSAKASVKKITMPMLRLHIPVHRLPHAAFYAFCKLYKTFEQGKIH